MYVDDDSFEDNLQMYVDRVMLVYFGGKVINLNQ